MNRAAKFVSTLALLLLGACGDSLSVDDPIEQSSSSDFLDQSSSSEENIAVSSSSANLNSSVESSSSTKVFNEVKPTYEGNPAEIANYTFKRYIAQFTDDPSELSFDEHVLAYNSNACYDMYESPNGSFVRLDYIQGLVDYEQIGRCFPKTWSQMYKQGPKENCKYYVVLEDDVNQPTGHVLKEITKDTVYFVNVYQTGDPCIVTNMVNVMSFLVEDCDGIMSGSQEASFRSYDSPKWNCGLDERGLAYGEWMRDDLLTVSENSAIVSSSSDGDVTWNKANLTWYESYPDEGSEECIEYNGCEWAGMFAGLDDKQTPEWVAEHNIIAVHEKDWETYKLKTFRLRKNGHKIDAVVYDMCSDADCDGCCTKNAGSTGFLIDIEVNTKVRFGNQGSGVVEWACLDCVE